jgi:hypothetical protein
MAVYYYLQLFSVVQNFGSLKNMRVYEQLVLILLFAGVVGIHAISHATLEKQYDYNPWRLFF